MTEKKEPTIHPSERVLVADKAAAEMLGIGRSTFRAAVAKGKFPQPLKLGGCTRWRVVEINKLIQQRNELANSVTLQDAPDDPEIADLPIDGHGFHLYRHFDKAGRLLYVGVSTNALRRLLEHQQSHWFADIARVEITNWATREASLRAERRAIKTERPLHNINHLLRRMA